MAVPWSGFPMKAFVDFARPLASAKFLRMETFNDPEVADGQNASWYPWPYVEGLTLAEATNEAMSYLDRCLDGGFRPGMGHILPDRMFWAQPDENEDGAAPDDGSDPDQPLDEETLRAIAALEAPHETRH